MDRFHFLDTSKYSDEADVQIGFGDGIEWVGVDGPSNFLDSAPNYDTFSPSTYVNDSDDNTYWEAINCASGDFVVTVENLAIIPSSLWLYIRTLSTDVASGITAYINHPFYVSYKSGQNDGLHDWSLYDTQYFASGVTTFAFPHTTGNFTDTYIPLEIDSGWAGYRNLIISGYPEISFRIAPNAACTGLIQVSKLGLYSSGSYNVLDNSIPLYIGSASTINSGLSLYTYGYDNLYSGISLHTVSTAWSSGNIPLYILGNSDDSGNIPLYISGIGRSTSTLPLVIGAAIYNTSSGNFPLYINSTTNSGLFNTIDLTVYNEADFDYRNTMVMSMSGGGILGSTTAILPLYLHNDNSVNSGISLYLCNEWALSSGTIPLYITTPSGTEGSVPLSGTMPLYMSREYEGVSYSSPLYICGPVQLNSGISMYINGEPSGLYSNVDMYISGVGRPIGTVRLYTRGF